MTHNRVKYKPKKQTSMRKKNTCGTKEDAVPLRLPKNWLTIALRSVNSIRANSTGKK
jgi:hypothetical protein